MSIILFTNTLDSGGVAKFFIRMNDAFHKHRIKSHIVCFKDEIKNIEDRINIFEKIKRIRDVSIEKKCTTIITNYGIETILAKIAIVGLDINIISIVHVRPNLFIYNNLTGIKKIIIKNLIHISFKICDKCVAVSESLRDELIKERWISENKIVTIYNPVISDNFISDKKEIKEKDEIHLGIIGWIYDIKNQKDAIKAIKKINDERFKLHIIGGIGDTDYFNEVKLLIKDLNLENQIFIEGIKEDILNEIKELDILLLTSKSEALPTVIIESLACGVPVISSDCKVGPREILDNGKYGYLYEEHNVNMICEYINELTNNPKKYTEFSELGIKRAKDFTYKKAVLKYMDTINQI